MLALRDQIRFGEDLEGVPLGLVLTESGNSAFEFPERGKARIQAGFKEFTGCWVERCSCVH